jgi:hypothetical protein
MQKTIEKTKARAPFEFHNVQAYACMSFQSASSNFVVRGIL